MVPEEQYKNAKPIEDYKAWEETAKNLPSDLARRGVSPCQIK